MEVSSGAITAAPIRLIDNAGDAELRVANPQRSGLRGDQLELTAALRLRGKGLEPELGTAGGGP